MIKRLLAGFVFALAVAFAHCASAQAPAGAEMDYAAFETVAGAAEEALAAGEAESARLESLRADLVEWRTRLQDLQSANDPLVENIQAQIDALGPPPDTAAGESEPDEIATRRAELQEQLDAAQAPELRASAAYQRVDGLIGQIDSEIARRRQELLLETHPLPINPANWRPTWIELKEFGRTLTANIETTLSDRFRRSEITRALPFTLGIFVLALVLLARGRIWMQQVTRWVERRSRRSGRITLGFLVSLGQIAVPVVGMTLFVVAILSTGILGEAGAQLLQGLLALVVATYCATWVLGRVFPVDSDLPATFEIPEKEQRKARRAGVVTGILVGLVVLIRRLGEGGFLSPDSEAVLFFPIAIGFSLSFYFLARMFRRAAKPEENEGMTFGQRLLRGIATVLIVVALVVPLIAAAGYHNLADAIAMPTAVTLALIGLFIALQAPIRDLYAWATRTSIETAGEALIPVLLNFFLFFAAIPLLAIIWGARPTELSDLWARASEGIAIGANRVTPGDILTVLFVFALGLAFTRMFQAALKTTVLPRTRLDTGARNAIASFAGYIGIGLTLLFAVTAGGIDLTALAVVFGALSVGIGFGLQNVVQNFVSGIILLIERPISEGDWIEVGGQMGIVKDISVRSTVIETFDKTQVIVPNADFVSNSVTNWTRGSPLGRAIVTVGVAYGTDTRRVAQILEEIAYENPHVARFPEPGVDFLGFGADSLDFRVRAILTDVNTKIATETELNHRIAERFAEEGIEIPFAQRDIWLRNPEILTGQLAEKRERPAAGENGRPRAGGASEGPEGYDDGASD